jgi:acrylyl-CoA reductase (NADPH)
MDRFKALVIRRDEASEQTSIAMEMLSPDALTDGDVDVAVEYSTVNYKDGLAITGTRPVVRKFPMIPGIDFAGTVTASRHPDFSAGDKVVLNGWGVGEVHPGGYSEQARVNGRAIHPARRFPARHQFGLCAKGAPHRGVGAPRPRGRPRQACGNHHHDRLR